MKVKDIIGNHEISLYVGYNRYGGGYVAMPVYGLDLDCVDLAFACGDDFHSLGTSMLHGLGLPFRTGDNLKDLINQILEVEFSYSRDGFCERFRHFSGNARKVYDLRPGIENGSMMKALAEEIDKDFPNNY